MSALIVIDASDVSGSQVRFVLTHGADPVTELAARGWVPVAPPTRLVPAGDPLLDGPPLTSMARALQARTESPDPWTVAIAYAVRAVDPAAPHAPPPLTRDEDLTDGEVANAEVYQRIAAYAFVWSERGLLLTELSEATNAAGQWNLPGGGLDEGERVLDGLRREIWEETDQVVEQPHLLGVLTSHWVGRAPRGRVEDYHAVRLIHVAHCPEPTEPVIHDVGGSTSAARWVPWTDVGQVPLVGSFASLIREVTGRHLAGS
jgi:8-oxo-dGTP diphosphatase